MLFFLESAIKKSVQNYSKNRKMSSVDGAVSLDHMYATNTAHEDIHSQNKQSVSSSVINTRKKNKFTTTERSNILSSEALPNIDVVNSKYNGEGHNNIPETMCKPSKSIEIEKDNELHSVGTYVVSTDVPESMVCDTMTDTMSGEVYFPFEFPHETRGDRVGEGFAFRGHDAQRVSATTNPRSIVSDSCIVVKKDQRESDCESPCLQSCTDPMVTCGTPQSHDCVMADSGTAETIMEHDGVAKQERGNNIQSNLRRVPRIDNLNNIHDFAYVDERRYLTRSKYNQSKYGRKETNGFCHNQIITDCEIPVTNYVTINDGEAYERKFNEYSPKNKTSSSSRQVLVTGKIYSASEFPSALFEPRMDNTYHAAIPPFMNTELGRLRCSLEKRTDIERRLNRLLPWVPQLLDGKRNVSLLTKSDGGNIKLGSGYYGQVYLASLSPSNHLVAVKFLYRTESSLADVIKEAAIMQRLSSSGITPNFHGMAPLHPHHRFHPLAIVCDFVGNDLNFKVTDFTDLVNTEYALLSRGCPSNMAYGDWIDLLFNLTSGLKRIHDLGVVINDFKADNILVRQEGSHWRPYIIDFGLASVGGDKPSIHVKAAERVAFMKKYAQIAPEIVNRSVSCAQSDVYSLSRVITFLSTSFCFPVDLDSLARDCAKHELPERITTNGILSVLLQFKNQLDNLR